MRHSIVCKKNHLNLLLIAIILSFGHVLSDNVNSTASDDCKGDDCRPSSANVFTPPPADAMSRLMPTSQAVFSNETKDQSASNVDIVTTPDTGSFGLGAFSKFSEQPERQHFSPSPFLGVISETHIKTYPQGMAVGEVLPDTIGNPHQGGHKYQYSIAGQRGQHTGHSYHDQLQHQRPTPSTAVDSGEAIVRSTAGTDSITFKPSIDTTYPSLTYDGLRGAENPFSSLPSSTKSLGDYPQFELPERFKDFKDISNSITDYRTPHPPIAFPGLVKPIREDLYDSGASPGVDDRPDAFGGGFGGGIGVGGGLPSGPEAFGPPPDLAGTDPIAAGYGAGLPPPPAFTSPPGILPYNKKVGYYKGDKWKGFFKVMASLIPLGLLVAAFTPNLLVVNGTENPTSTAKTIYRSLEEPLLPTPPAVDVRNGRSLTGPGNGGRGIPPQSLGLHMTQCQKKKVCEALAGVDGSYKDYVDTLIHRVGGGLREAAAIAADKKCQDIRCVA
ncbi:Hypothetical protein NTJ_06253 [Nesidiocoris tenuis]|uniref:Uncharacterized protein n=1 Tax=Nesidiocoris tenuis TaxID=355587 RepID=A0ABN7AMH2_9HEMI|nr:Hypothetical protein NTJ_06253 [Nesidiocoris tenuis]